MEEKQSQELVGVWQYIPRSAFLYFPLGQQIKVGSGQKQWRKIFEGNQTYDSFQEDALNKLQQKLVLSKIQVSPWFDRANKLRYLQANKWKKTPTCEALAQYSRYRKSQFPIKQSHDILYMLNKGTFYILGRDQQYRPIIVADLGKFDKKDVQLIPPTLIFIMEFVINNFMIQGQVQNYVLIMNLSTFQFSQKSLVSKIVSFTSNSYRGRLFVSYLLGAPYLLRVGWNSFAQGFVSENTFKKLKVTGDLHHDDMWSHIDKEIIQKKYGGLGQNFQSKYWPVNLQRLLYESKNSRNVLISIEEYNKKFSNLELQNRKVLKSLLRRKTIIVHEENKSTIIQPQKDLVIESRKVLDRIDKQSLTDATILIQSSVFPEDLKFIRTFFQSSAYLKIK